MLVRSTDDGEVDIMSLSDVTDLLGTEDDFNPTHSLENDMPAKKKAPAAAAPAAAPAPAKKSKKAAAAPAAAEAEATGGPRAVPEGHTGLAALAESLGIKPAAARRKLRAAEVAKPEGQHGWYWKDGSKDLAAVTKALTPEPEAAAK